MFQTISFNTPSILFGMDTINQLGKQAQKLGAGRTLLVTGPNVRDAGILDRALSYLKAESIDVEVNVQGRDTPEPATSVVEDTAEVARKGKFEVIIGLGGGSIVSQEPLKIGPQSVGYELTTKGLIFGGSVLTATDIAVAGGLADIGDSSAVKNQDAAFVREALDEIQTIVETAVDRMKTSAEPIPLILVGGGIILVSREVEGASEMVKPEHFPVANAIGAAIAQVGGETDRIFALAEIPRDKALAQAKQEASDKVKAAGADAKTITIVDVEEIPLTYLPSNAVRVRVKAVGDLAFE